MIDIHCHILPDFDDGSSSLEESLIMAHMAASTGVSGIVATPHFPGEPGALARSAELLEKFRLLQDAIREEEIPVTLIPGAEILCLPETPELAKAHQLPTIGDTNYVLTEFDFGSSAASMDRMLHELAEAGYRPVVAHPERYRAVQQDLRLMEHWFGAGFVLQLNKGSLLGAFGSRVQMTAGEIIARGLAHLIASDAHGTDRRTTHMAALNQWVRGHCSPEYAKILLTRNPARLVEGRDMVPG